MNQPKFANAQYYLPIKSERVIEPHNQVAWKSRDGIMADIELRLGKKSAPMIWVKKPSGVSEKIFVVWR